MVRNRCGTFNGRIGAYRSGNENYGKYGRYSCYETGPAPAWNDTASALGITPQIASEQACAYVAFYDVSDTEYYKSPETLYKELQELVMAAAEKWGRTKQSPTSSEAGSVCHGKYPSTPPANPPCHQSSQHQSSQP